MRRMYSEKQIVGVINDAIASGEIEAGGLKLVASVSTGHAPGATGIIKRSYDFNADNTFDETKPCVFVMKQPNGDIPLQFLYKAGTQYLFLVYDQGATSVGFDIYQ